LEPAAAAFVAAYIRADRLSVRSEAALGGHAPVRGLLISIIKRRFRRIYHSIDVHALGPKTEAVQPDGNLWRGQRFHEVAPGSDGLDAGGVQDRPFHRGLGDLNLVRVLAQRTGI